MVIKCSSPSYCKHCATVTAPERSRDTVKVFWNWDFLLENKGHHQTPVFPCRITNKNPVSDPRLIPFPTWNHPDPRGILLQAFWALLILKPGSSFCSYFPLSSKPREAKHIIQKGKKKSIIQKEKLQSPGKCLPYTSSPQHTSVHTIRRLHLLLVPKVPTLLISFPDVF